MQTVHQCKLSLINANLGEDLFRTYPVLNAVRHKLINLDAECTEADEIQKRGKVYFVAKLHPTSSMSMSMCRTTYIARDVAVTAAGAMRLGSIPHAVLAVVHLFDMNAMRCTEARGSSSRGDRQGVTIQHICLTVLDGVFGGEHEGAAEDASVDALTAPHVHAIRDPQPQHPIPASQTTP